MGSRLRATCLPSTRPQPTTIVMTARYERTPGSKRSSTWSWLSQQSHTDSRARAIYPPSSARLQRTPRRRRSASVQRRVASPPLPTSPHLSWRGTTHRRSGRQSDMAGRAPAIYLGCPPASRPRDDGERREESDVHMGSRQEQDDGFGGGGRRAVSSMAALAWGCWWRTGGGSSMAAPAWVCLCRADGTWKSRRDFWKP